MTVSGSSNRIAATSARTSPRPSETFCLASAVRSARPAGQILGKAEQIGDLGDTRLDRAALDAAVLQRECEIFARRSWCRR